MQNVVSNGEDDIRLPRSHRGIDLTASPRTWETNPSDQPVDFSGMDLSSRRQLNTPSYRPQNLTAAHQHKEMDLSTKKTVGKTHTNLVRIISLIILQM